MIIVRSNYVTQIQREKWELAKATMANSRLRFMSSLADAVKRCFNMKYLNLDCSKIQIFMDQIIVTLVLDPGICGPIRTRYHFVGSWPNSGHYGVDSWPVIGSGFQRFAIPRATAKPNWEDRPQWLDPMQWYYTNDLDEAIGASEETGSEIRLAESKTGFKLDSFPMVEPLFKNG